MGLDTRLTHLIKRSSIIEFAIFANHSSFMPFCRLASHRMLLLYSNIDRFIRVCSFFLSLDRSLRLSLLLYLLMPFSLFVAVV